MSDLKRYLPGSSQGSNQSNNQCNTKEDKEKGVREKREKSNKNPKEISEGKRDKFYLGNNFSGKELRGKKSKGNGFSGGVRAKRHQAAVALFLALLMAFSVAVPRVEAATDDGSRPYFIGTGQAQSLDDPDGSPGIEASSSFYVTRLFSRVLIGSYNGWPFSIFSDQGLLQRLWETLNLLIINGEVEQESGAAVQRTSERSRPPSDSTGDDIAPPSDDADSGGPEEPDSGDPGEPDPADPDGDIEDPNLIDPGNDENDSDEDPSNEDEGNVEPGPEVHYFNLQLNTEGLGTVTSSVYADGETETGKIIVGSNILKKGSQITLTAVPAEGCVFLHWNLNGEEKDELFTDDEMIIADIQQNLQATAHFEEEIITPIYSVTIQSAEGGNVAFHHTHNSDEKMLAFEEGDQVRVGATPNDLYQFSHWEIRDESNAEIADALELTFEDLADKELAFRMPANNVVAKAYYDFIHPFEGGTGKEGDPYQIKTAEQLSLLLGNNPQLAAGYADFDFRINLMEAHYQLVDVIDLKGVEWSPVGGNGASFDGSAAFTGTFDGNGKSVKNLSINQTDKSYQAMFHTIGSGAVVNNLTLFDPSITAKSHAAVLAVNNLGIVEGVTVKSTKTPASPLNNNLLDPAGSVVTVNAGSNNDAYCAGLVALNGTTGTIHQSGVSISIKVTGQYSGLLVGENRGIISESYSIGNITGGGSNYQGGLVGYNNNSTNGIETLVENSYAIAILSDAGNYRGGVIGGQFRSKIIDVSVDKQISVKHVYGVTTMGNMTGDGIGGVLGGFGRDMIKSYFNADIFQSNQNANVKKGTPLTGNQMKIKSSFVETDDEDNGWNFSTIWHIDSREDRENAINKGYPYLRWQYTND